MFFGCEDVSVILDRNGLFAILNEALKYDCEKLLQCGLNGALDR